MAKRINDDEKNEKIIRGLLKLPGNRRCINCNSLGPQYVCTNFWTFVCTACSGMHREFTHRIKSISMAKFTSEEVNALRGGGNERAKEIYFKEWEPRLHSLPDNSNTQKLRDFIKHVYVFRKYTGERSIDKPTRMKTGKREDLYEKRDSHLGGSRTLPPSESTFERRFSERSRSVGQDEFERKYKHNYDEKRNQVYEQEFRQASRRTPVRFEVVDDRYRDDDFGNGRRFEVSRFPGRERESMPKERVPHRHRSLDMSSHAVVRSVRDILLEDVPKENGSPKENGNTDTHGSSHLQRTASSSSTGSNNVNSVEVKTENLASLIEFDIDPKPADETVASPAKSLNAPGESSIVPSKSPSIGGDNLGASGSSTQSNLPPTQNLSVTSTIEDALFELSAPTTATVGNLSMSPAFSDVNPSYSGTPSNQASNIPPGQNTQSTIGQPSQDVLLPNQHSFLFSATPSPIPIPSVGGTPNNQVHDSSQGLFTAQIRQPSPPAPAPVRVTSTEGALSPASLETKSNERRELPADLFTAPYSSVPVPPFIGWQAIPACDMSYGNGMPHPTFVPCAGSPRPSKSVNPFDIESEPTSVQAQPFPNMASLQRALPDIAAPPSIPRTSSLGNPSLHWMAPQDPSYGSAVPPASYASTLPPSPYMVQQIPNNMSTLGYQGIGYSSANEGIFGTSNKGQQMTGIYSKPDNQNYFTSLGGNPFG